MDDSMPVLWLLCPQVTAEGLAPECNREARKAELNRIFCMRALLLPCAGPCSPGPVHGMLRSADLQTSASLGATQRPRASRGLAGAVPQGWCQASPAAAAAAPGLAQPAKLPTTAGGGQAFPGGSAAKGILSRQGCSLATSHQAFSNQLPR